MFFEVETTHIGAGTSTKNLELTPPPVSKVLDPAAYMSISLILTKVFLLSQPSW